MNAARKKAKLDCQTRNQKNGSLSIAIQLESTPSPVTFQPTAASMSMLLAR